MRIERLPLSGKSDSKTLHSGKEKNSAMLKDEVILSTKAISSGNQREDLNEVKSKISAYFNLLNKLDIEEKYKEKGNDRLAQFLKNVDIISENNQDFALSLANHKLSVLQSFERHYKESSNLKGYFKDTYYGSFNIGVLSGDLQVIRDSQPSRKDFEWLIKKAGIKTVINLRTEEDYWQGFSKKDEERICKENGVKYKNFSLEDKDDPPPSKDQIEEVLKYIDSHEKPVLFHCALGKGRTGMTAAAYRLSKQKAGYDEVIKEAAHYGFDKEKNTNQAKVIKEFAR